METRYDSKDENPHRHSDVGQMKYLQQTLNSMNAFLLLLVMSYVVSHFKLLRMPWYRSMKPFRTNLQIFIKRHLCSLHYYFPGFENSSNNVMLIEMSRYICLYNFNTISLDFIYTIFKIKCYV